eukprot:3627664-Prymnesium_polylepis.1
MVDHEFEGTIRTTELDPISHAPASSRNGNDVPCCRNGKGVRHRAHPAALFTYYAFYAFDVL